MEDQDCGTWKDVRAAALGIFLAVRIWAGPEIATVGGNIHLRDLWSI
ncbi:hypothetical protein OROHE_002695 [Orobanche hederae]